MIIQKFEQADGNGIGFFAGRAGGDPNSDRGIGKFWFKNRRKDFGFKRLKSARIAKETGYVNQNIVIKQFNFAGIILNKEQVGGEIVEVMQCHAPHNAPNEGAAFVVAEVYPHRVFQ